MVQKHLSQAVNDNIVEIIDVIENDYYTELEKKCKVIWNLTLRLKSDDTANSVAVYSNLCHNFVIITQNAVNQRKEFLLPFFEEYSKNTEKKEKMNFAHKPKDLQEIITTIEDSQYKIRDLIYRLQKVALPLYGETEYPQNYKLLRNKMIKIETMIIEMLFFEESVLIPRLMATR